jgi:hypothetical protein
VLADYLQKSPRLPSTPSDSIPADLFQQEKGRQALARQASGEVGFKQKQQAANTMMGAVRKGLQISEASGGVSLGTPAMRRSLQSQAPIPPQQPKVASVEVFSEFVKHAMTEAERRKQHQYYMQHRNEILAAKRAYRARNQAEISKKQKAYRRKVKMGVKKQRQRISTGGNSFIYGGFR